MAYIFRPAACSDLETLADWHRLPHVARWWNTAPSFSENDLADPRMARWMIETEGNAFAYMQDYDVHGWKQHHFSYLPQGSRGIDQFIGPVEMIGYGHGPRFIAQRLKSLFRDGTPVVATDPHPENARAIAACKRSGFHVVDDPRQTQWGIILPMEAHREQSVTGSRK
jgi:aminoglycoside 6'-N-acetyltransferase